MSLCCDQCFADEYLQEYIRENGKEGYCDFCEEDREYCIEPSELYDLFEPLISFYTPVEDFMPLEEMKEREGDLLWEKLVDDWGVFDEYDPDRIQPLLESIYLNIYDRKEGYPIVFSSHVESEYDYWGGRFEYEDKYRKIWDKFCEEIKYSNRYFPKLSEDFDLEIDDLLSFKSGQINKDTILYRARINDKILPPEEMGKPPNEVVSDGRGNPIGISYLYLASNENTAVAEVKPFINDKLTIGKFIVNENLNMIDLRDQGIGSPFKYGDKLMSVIILREFLKILDYELSRPINPNASRLEYLPSQYLCELIKDKRFDGIIYRSGLGDGYNIMIFNDNRLQCKDTWQLNVAKLSYKYIRVEKNKE